MKKLIKNNDKIYISGQKAQGPTMIRQSPTMIHHASKAGQIYIYIFIEVDITINLYIYM